MATSTVRQLVINITTTNTWTQLTEGVGGSAYTVPANSRADIKFLSANNLDADAAVINFAVSTNSTIADNEYIWPIGVSLATKEYADDDSVHVMRAGEGLWARATGTTPNCTFNATVLEIAP